MAHVITSGRLERAQLLLITALALAVILVTVALLLNAAIFTENVATRDTTADGPEAAELRGELIEGVGELLEEENQQEQEESEILENVESGIDEMAPMVERERARHGTIATLNYDPNDIETGELLRYGDDGNHKAFDDTGNNWTVASELDGLRALSVGLDPSSLNETTAETSDEAFGVQFNSSSSENVTLHIYDDQESERHLAVDRVHETEPGEPQRLCRIEHDGTTPVEIDITGDRLSSGDVIVECHRELWPDNDPETLEFINIDTEVGTSEVTIADGNAGSAMTATDAIYSVSVEVSYQSQDLTFETTADIAPGEPR